MPGILIVVIAILVVVALWAVATYNRLIGRRNRVDNAWSQVDVQLKRRWDLIPNLVETVKGYASHEQRTFERVVQARNASQAATTPVQQAGAENVLTGALRQLFAIAEAYPELKASTNFSELSAQLSETENKVSVARQIYNDSVLTYNNAVQQVPSSIIAGLANFSTREFFDSPVAAEEAPRVQF